MHSYLFNLPYCWAFRLFPVFFFSSINNYGITSLNKHLWTHLYFFLKIQLLSHRWYIFLSFWYIIANLPFIEVTPAEQLAHLPTPRLMNCSLVPSSCRPRVPSHLSLAVPQRSLLKWMNGTWGFRVLFSASWGKSMPPFPPHINIWVNTPANNQTLFKYTFHALKWYQNSRLNWQKACFLITHQVYFLKFPTSNTEVLFQSPQSAILDLWLWTILETDHWSINAQKPSPFYLQTDECPTFPHLTKK